MKSSNHIKGLLVPVLVKVLARTKFVRNPFFYKIFLFCECCTFMTILLYFIEIVFESSFRFIWGLRCIKSEDRLKPNQWKENMDSAPHPILNKYLSIFNIFKISIGHLSLFFQRPVKISQWYISTKKYILVEKIFNINFVCVHRLENNVFWFWASHLL